MRDADFRRPAAPAHHPPPRLTGLAAVSLGLAGTGTSILEMTTALHEAGVAPLVRAAVGGALAYHFGHGMRHLVRPRARPPA